MASSSDFMTTREVAKTLGVGLTTVQNWVESGSLPAWKTAGGHRRIPVSAVEKLLSAQESTLDDVQFTVLVVEDGEFERGMYRQQFIEWKLPVRLLLARDGYEGLLLAGRHTPDCIIADLSMPLMNGIKMIENLYQISGDEKPLILIVTGLNPEQIAAMGTLPPEIPVYPKPVPFTALRQLIQRHIQNRSTIRRSRDLVA